MRDTTQTADLNRCPNCGVALDPPGTRGMCPACLMSGVLRTDTDTTAIPDDANAPLADLASARDALSARDFALPHEFGDYTLVALLGRGGMGTVFEAVQRSTGRRLALKLLAQNLDSPEMRQRFLREGRLAARVNHPSSLYVFGSEEINGVPAITMEIAASGTLQDALDQRGPLPISDAVDGVLSMIDGLEAALDRGVLHRDIKPSNCFVCPDGTVKVGDFGLSVSTLPSGDSLVTEAGRVMCTPAFAPPEQLRGDELDARADIYAVGATLFALLTGDAPFDGDNAVQVAASVIDSPPPDAARLRTEVSPALGRVVTRCLAKDPPDRYANYQSLRDALLPFSSAVPVPATQAQRTAAGWIDYLTAFLPAYATLMITVGPEQLFIRPLYSFTFEVWQYHLLVFATGFLYFAVTEGAWGTGLGKWMMNLRVVTKQGRRPGVIRALLRIAIPIVAIESVRVPLSIALLPAGEWTTVDAMVLTGLSILCPWIAALLWMPARESNGFTTSWDLLTGTRVVVRPRGSRRPSQSASSQSGASASTNHDIGPFVVTSTIAAGTWLAAQDPALRRSVWLILRDDRGVSPARRAAARPGRARWLQQIDAEGATWDAYEADHGTPLREQLRRGSVPWSTLRFWLHDLAAELRASERDDTAAFAYSIDQVWITDDGRAMLLDDAFPCDGHHAAPIAVDTLAGQHTFLHAIAEHVDPLSVPLHARPVLQNLQSGSFEKLTFLVGTLRGVLNKPADTRASLRGASLLVIPGYATIATFLGIAANTAPSAGLTTWLGRAMIAVLVMMHFIAFSDLVLAFWRKSTGLTTFGMEVVTKDGRASRTRLLARCAVMWLPVVAPTVALAVHARLNGTWISFEHAAMLGAVALAGSSVFVATALMHPARGLHDRLAGVWIGRR